MKKIICYLVVMLLLGSFCWTPSFAQTPLAREFKIGTSRVGGLHHTTASSIAQIVMKHTPMKMKVISTGGPTTWLPMMERKEIDLGVINVFEVQQAYYGKMMYEEMTKGKGYNILILSLGSPSTLGALARSNSPVQRLTDLKGKKFPRFKGQLALDACFMGFLANAGLTYDDVVQVQRASLYDTVMDDMREGKVDATVLPLNSAKVIELHTALGIRFLNCDDSPEAMKRTREVFPYYIERVTKGAGINEPTNLLSYNNTISAREDLGDEAAYEIVKTIWENYEELGAIHGYLKTWTPEIMVSPIATVPYHPGAVKWYKEKGAWTNELEQRQKSLIKK